MFQYCIIINKLHFEKRKYDRGITKEKFYLISNEDFIHRMVVHEGLTRYGNLLIHRKYEGNKKMAMGKYFDFIGLQQTLLFL